jgi:hypothetical protein
MLVEGRVRRSRLDGHVARSALGVEAKRDGDRFHERRFAAPVFPGEECHVWAEVELYKIANRGNRERIGVGRPDLVALQDD